MTLKIVLPFTCPELGLIATTKRRGTIAVALFALGTVPCTPVYAGQAHIVTVGSPDGNIVTSGGDGNFLLVARVDANGNVSGQWEDAFTRNPGFHINVTCLTVVGNTAWISGVITQASDNSLIGAPVVTEVVDNSKDGKGDKISFSFYCPPVCTNPLFCTDMPALPLFEINSGNVIVK